MTNTELTLDQLQAVSGGGNFMKLGDIKGEYRQIVHPQYRNRLGTNSGPGGTSFRTAENFADAYSNSLSGFRECSAL